LRSADRTPTDERLRKYERVLRVLEDHQWHTTRELMDAGGHRFSDCIYVLRRKGHLIDTSDAPTVDIATSKGVERYEYRLRRPGEDVPLGAHYVSSVFHTVKRARRLAGLEAAPGQQSLPLARGAPCPHCGEPLKSPR